MIKIAYLVSEPIIYQEPMLQYLAQQPDVHLKVFYRSQRAIKNHKLKGFGITATWDIEFLKHYDYQFLPVLGSDMKFNALQPLNYGLARHLRREQYDILWVHGYSSFLQLNALRVAKKLGMKTLIRGDSTLYSCEPSRFRSMLRNSFFKWLQTQTDGFLTIGSQNQAFYQYYQIPKQKLYFAPYSVNNEHFKAVHYKHQVPALRQSLGLSAEQPVVLFASKMLELKRGIDLVEAVRCLKQRDIKRQPQVIFIGDGPKRNYLERAVADYQLSNVQFLGFKNQSQLPAYYALADIFVLPSRREAWGLVVNEAMNGECAILTTQQVGSAHDLVDQANGFIFEAKDVTALTQALAYYMDNEQALQQAKQCSAKRISHWDITHTAQGVIQTCQNLLQ